MAAKTLRNSLTAEQLRAALTYDPETGIFTWRYRTDQRKEWNTRFAGKPTGSHQIRGGISIVVNYKHYRAHRLAWLYMTGEWPAGLEVDHIDCNQINNAWKNLRKSTRRQNASNTRIKPHNTSGFKGVFRDKKRWRAQIKVNYQSIHLGTFDTREEAHAAYAAAAQRLNGEFARLS